MAHPTRTGDLVVFAYPPYEFDAATPGTLIARSQFFGQHGYVPDVQNLAANINMRATFIAGGPGIAKASVTARTIDLAPTLAYILGIPEPQQSQGRVLTEILKGGNSIKPISIVGLTDFHGQLEQSTLNTFDNAINVPVGGAAALATMFDEEFATLPGPGLLVASGDNVGASPANSGLLQDKPAIDVENAWGLDATSLGNHEFDYGVRRLQDHVARAHFPFLATNVVETATGNIPDYLQPSKVFTINGIQVGVIGAELKSTPELVSANATAGLTFLDEATRIKAESERLKALGVNVQIVVIHQGATVGLNPIGNAAGAAWDGPILGIADAIQDTTVDMMFVGHTHRISNFVRGRIPIVEGYNAGMSYSVAQLMVRDGDVVWAGGATRVAKNLGVAQRADVKAIVDDANAQTAVLRNQVIGTQQFDIKRDPTRLHESAMGNMVADSMRLKYPGVEAALTNSGGLRADLELLTAERRRAPCEITWGEAFAVLPFGNRTVIETVTGSRADGRVRQRLPAGVRSGLPRRHRPVPAGVGPQGHVPLQRPCPGRGRDLEGAERTQRDAHAGRPDATRSGSSRTTSCTRWARPAAATATRRSCRRARTSSNPATTCSRSRSTTSPPIRPSARWSRGGSSGRNGLDRRDPRRAGPKGPALSLWHPYQDRREWPALRHRHRKFRCRSVGDGPVLEAHGTVGWSCMGPPLPSRPYGRPSSSGSVVAATSAHPTPAGATAEGRGAHVE